MYELLHYQDEDGTDLFAKWLDGLADIKRAIKRWNEWKKGKEMSTVKHNDWLFEQLKDAEFAAEYLNAASEDDDPKTYLTALRKVVEARGGMASVAQKTDLSRETL